MSSLFLISRRWDARRLRVGRVTDCFRNDFDVLARGVGGGVGMRGVVDEKGRIVFHRVGVRAC